MAEIKQKKKRSLFHKIVNVFIGIIIGLLVLIILVIGFTQTKTFRELLRKQVISAVNNSINGKLNIEKIDGSILTSVILRNTSLTFKNDTILYAQKIEVLTNPLALLAKRIKVRYFEIANTNITLLKDSTGVLNISKLAKPKPVDTTSSEFPFTIKVDELKFNNVKFRMCSYKDKDSTRNYSRFNMDDLVLDNLYLTLQAEADIKEKNFGLIIGQIKARTNFNGFVLQDLKGNFEVTDHYAKISDFVIRTNTTDLSLSAELDKVNLFNNFEVGNLKNSPMKLKLNARVFDFSDLATYVSATDFMKGTLKTEIDISGKFGDADINKINIDYLQTHLNLAGNVKNLHKPSEMYITAHIKNSEVNYPDINKLLPLMNLPKYNVVVKNLESDYEGSISRFKAALRTNINEGSLKTEATFDFTDLMKYDINVSTSNIDLSPFINSKTKLNSKIAIKGVGTSLQELNSNAQINLSESSFQNYFIDTLNLNADAWNGNVFLRLKTITQKSAINMNGEIDFNNEDNPVYNFNGSVKNLNLAKMTGDTSSSSNLNFAFNLKGQDFHIETMNSEFDLKVINSQFRNIKIDSLGLKLKYLMTGNERRINVISDLADIDVTGKFNITQVASILGYETKIISNSMMKKIYEINPVALFNDSLKAKKFEYQLKIDDQEMPDLSEPFNLTYKIGFKDIRLIAQFANLDQVELIGTISGDISNNENKFAASSDLAFEKIRVKTGDNLILVHDLGLTLDVGRNNTSTDFRNVYADLNFKTTRVFSGTDLKDINISLNLADNILNYNIGVNVDTTLNAVITGLTDLTSNRIKIDVNKLVIKYLNYEWSNDSNIVALYTKDAFEIKKLTLLRNGSAIDIAGKIYSDGKENVDLKVSNLDMDIIKKFAGLNRSDLKANINLAVKLNGYLHDPLIDVSLDVDSINANNTNLGEMHTKLNYKKLMLDIDLRFVDSTASIDNPDLLLSGKFPVDLAFVGAKDRIPKGKPLDISLKSSNFELSTFSSFIPVVRNLSGKLISDLKLEGTSDHINHSGSIKISDGSFTAIQNNLTYGIDVNVLLQQQAIIIDNITLKNTGGTDHKGTLTGKGSVSLNGYKPENIEITLNGNLAVLSQNSRGANPYLYGDLVIASEGDWRFTNKDGVSSFDGTVFLRNTNVTVPQFQSSYSSGTEYIYHYRADTTHIDRRQEEFNKEVVTISRRYRQGGRRAIPEESGFNYNLRIKIDDEAKLNVILNQETNQSLYVVLKGDLLFRSGGIAQGKFELQEGSQLKFIKTFKAEGNIYFERDPANPRLDITATYLGEHKNLSSEIQTEPTPVAVKIKLEGPVDKLGENLATSSDENIKIYEGEDNIDNNTPSADKDAADAISFILIGKYKDELTAEDKTQQGSMISGYTTSALGGLLSGFANSQLGDVIRNIELENQGTTTRFSVSGKVRNLRYTLGGTTDDFQDLSKANVRFEFPFGDNFLLKFERKDPLVEKTSNVEKINEISLKYKFLF